MKQFRFPIAFGIIFMVAAIVIGFGPHPIALAQVSGSVPINVQVTNAVPSSCPSPPGKCAANVVELNNPFFLSKQWLYTPTPIAAASTTFQILPGSTTVNEYPFCVTVSGNVNGAASGQLKVGTSSGGAQPVGPGVAFASTAGSSTLFWPIVGGAGTAGQCLTVPFWIYLPAGATTTNLYLTTGASAPSPSPGVQANVWYLNSNNQ